MTRSPILRLIAALTILAIPMAAFGADAVGKASGGGPVIQWEVTSGNYDSIELTVVTPDGESIVKKFAAGRTPSLRLLDLGVDAANGQYQYELRMIPKVSAELKSRLEAARQTGDDAVSRNVIREAGLAAPAQSGTFTIKDGSIVSPDPIEGGPAGKPRSISADAAIRLNPATEDNVITDDLIVQGSACIGLDCVNNETFGFDSLRFKENNIRVKFEDTSVGTFPSNDWMLTANDSAGGGANKFSIEDVTGSRVPFTVTAGAATNSIFVDSSGRVGFRTATPGKDLHVNATDSPGLRLEQNNSGGFTAQTWDVGGNEANFFVRDVTSGNKLSFRIRPGAPTSSLDIRADGDIGMFTADPNALLHVQAIGRNPGAGNASLMVTSNSGEDAIIGLGVGPNFSTGVVPINTDAFVFGYNGAAGAGRGFIGTRPTTGTGEINIAVKNTTVMKVVSTGIEVTGSVKVNGTTMNVPDYVFHDGYKLMPLDELSKFIAENKHLPEIPSEAEIKAQGLDLGQFHMSLLKKIEELTLHTIAQQETIRELEAQKETIQSLEARLAALEGAKN